MLKKQTAVFHSSTDAEFFSPDAGSRKEQLLAAHVWDVFFGVLTPL